MTKNGIIHPEICKILSMIGHTQTLVVADAGLPIPNTVRRVVDLSFLRGVPDFISVVSAIRKELIVESYIYAEEIETANPLVYKSLRDTLADVPSKSVSHAKLKEMSEHSFAVIKTGECSPYSNIIFVAGVDF